MKGSSLLVCSIIASLCTASLAQAQAPDYFSGFYGGFEGGPISYNTQITFDGVDDPAGRGHVMYGAFLGYNHAPQTLLAGAELSVHLAPPPDPYTFDPAVVGFSELDLRRGASVGLDLRAGYVLLKRLLLYGNVGYSVNRQSVRIDGVPLEEFAGGAAPQTFGAFQFGAGLEGMFHPHVGIRTSVRTLAGHDLSATDFGTIPTDASLARFDVEPSQVQFLVGLIVHV